MRRGRADAPAPARAARRGARRAGADDDAEVHARVVVSRRRRAAARASSTVRGVALRRHGRARRPRRRRARARARRRETTTRRGSTRRSSEARRAAAAGGAGGRPAAALRRATLRRRARRRGRSRARSRRRAARSSSARRARRPPRRAATPRPPPRPRPRSRPSGSSSTTSSRANLARALRSGDDAAVAITQAQAPFGIVHVSPRWCGLCGFDAVDAVGSTFRLIQGPETDKPAIRVASRGCWRREPEGAPHQLPLRRRGVRHRRDHGRRARRRGRGRLLGGLVQTCLRARGAFISCPRACRVRLGADWARGRQGVGTSTQQRVRRARADGRLADDGAGTVSQRSGPPVRGGRPARAPFARGGGPEAAAPPPPPAAAAASAAAPAPAPATPSRPGRHSIKHARELQCTARASLARARRRRSGRCARRCSRLREEHRAYFRLLGG